MTTSDAKHTVEVYTPPALIHARRQYRHNNGDGFVCGYDFDATNLVVVAYEQRITDFEQSLATTKAYYENVIADGTKRITDLERQLAEAQGSVKSQVGWLYRYVDDVDAASEVWSFIPIAQQRLIDTVKVRSDYEVKPAYIDKALAAEKQE